MKANKTTKMQKKVLLINNDVSFNRIVDQMLDDVCTVKTCTAQKEALKTIKDGYMPGVIITEKNLDGLETTEFLDHLKRLAPNSIQIILTDDTEAEDLKAIIRSGKAKIFLTKKSRGFELQQVINMAFDHYFQEISTKSLKNEIKSKQTNIKRVLTESKSVYPQFLQAVTGIVGLAERLYFTSHTRYTAMLSRSIASYLEFEVPRIQTTVISSLLYSSIMMTMPSQFRIKEPYDLNPDEKMDFLEFFGNSLRVFSKIDFFRKHARIIAQVWELYDGTGLPNNLKREQISLESQIINISSFYHNSVYRIEPLQMDQFQSKGYITQSKLETKKRHDAAIKTLYKRTKQFDVDVFQAFQDIVKRRLCYAGIPWMEDLELNCVDKGMRKRPKPKPRPVETYEGSDIITMKKETGEQQYVEQELHFSEIEPGMKTAQNIMTKKGLLVVRYDVELDRSQVMNLRQLAESGMITEYLSMMIPVEEKK